MITMNNKSLPRGVLYLGLVLILFYCVWLGWSDFDPRIPQELVRNNIRSGIRSSLQVIVQYIVPVSIIAFFVREIMASRRSKQAIPPKRI